MASEMSQMEQRLKEMIAELQNKPSIQATQKAQKQIKAHQEELAKQQQKLKAKKAEREAPTPRNKVELKVGSKVHVPSLQ